MKQLLIILAVLFCTTRLAAQTKQDTSQTYVIVFNAQQLQELFYVIGTSGEISANDIKKYEAALQKKIGVLPQGYLPDSAYKKPSPVKKPK